MPEPAPRSRRIAVLRDEVSRKIAAGEVIDRRFPFRAGAAGQRHRRRAGAIDVYLESGGLSRIRRRDDGSGMDEDDLALCWKPHATSKIETEDDLLTASSLGFRGEALSSVALCSRLVMVSCGEEGGAAHRLEVHGDGWSRSRRARAAAGRWWTSPSCSSTTPPGGSSCAAPPPNRHSAVRSSLTGRQLTRPSLFDCSRKGRSGFPFSPRLRWTGLPTRTRSRSMRVFSASRRRRVKGSPCASWREPLTSGGETGSSSSASSTRGESRSSLSCRPWSSASPATCPAGGIPRLLSSSRPILPWWTSTFTR